MACRDIEKAEVAQKAIVEDSGNQNIVIKKLDLADTKSIREFAEEINKGKSHRTDNDRQSGTGLHNSGRSVLGFSKLFN